MGSLNSANYKVRRATLEDLKGLSALWLTMSYDVEVLCRHITEFQVVEDAAGALVGAVGLQVADRQGLIHSESFTDFSQADVVRPLLWERIKNLANNHGLLRLWTREQAPFWRQCGLGPAQPEHLQLLPPVWRGGVGNWLTLKLKEDVEALVAMDHELALMLQSERRRARDTLQHARVLKMIATVLGIVIVLFILGVSIWVMLRRGSLPPPG